MDKVLKTKALKRLPGIFLRAPFWGRSGFRIYGIVKVVKTTLDGGWSCGVYDHYNLSDDIINPDGASLFFLVAIPNTNQVGQRYFITKMGRKFVEAGRHGAIADNRTRHFPVSVSAFGHNWSIDSEEESDPLTVQDAKRVRQELKKWQPGKSI